MARKSHVWLILAGCALVCAQMPLKEVSIRTTPYTPPGAILHAESNLVETGLIVRDDKGRAARGLHAADLEVLDNGEPKPIASFVEVDSPVASSSETNGGRANMAKAARPLTEPALQPKYVTFFFDDFHVPNGSMLFVKQAARKYIAEGVKPGDHLSIATASGQGDLDFTADAAAFRERLEHLSAHVRAIVPHPCGVSPIDSYIFLHNLDGQIAEMAIGAAMGCAGCDARHISAQCRAAAYAVAQDAASTTWEQMRATSIDTLGALDAAAQRLARTNGRRALVLTSSGFLLRPGVPPELQTFIDNALRRDIVVDAIGTQGLEARMTGAKDMVRTSFYLMPLQNIANGTGGHYFRDTNDLAGAMHEAADPEVTYTLAFNAGAPDAKFHTLKIRFRNKRADDLQFRPGYFSPDPKQDLKSALAARSRMDDAVFSKESLREIPIGLSLAVGEPKNEGIPLSVRYTIDVKALEFHLASGRHVQQLVFLTALLDANGGFVAGKESIMELALTDARLASLKTSGLTAVTTLNGQAGQYQLRAIVREGVKGNLAAVTTPVELRGR